jgi:ABC-2 type transport system permease protein
MVSVLIDLRRTVARRQLAMTHPAIVLTVLGMTVLSAIGTLLLGWLRQPQPAAETDVLALVAALWIGGRIAQCALSGEPILRPEIFAVLPIRRRRLARALLVVGLSDPANVLLVVALAGVVRFGARLDAAAAGTAVIAVGLTVVLTSLIATVAAGLLGPGSRRGHDAGTIITALLISVVAMTGTLLPALISTLRQRSAPWLSDALRALPSGWGPRAVEAAGNSDAAGTVIPLAGLVLLNVVVVLVWPSVLRRRMQNCQPVRRRSLRDRRARRLLGNTATAAVAAKELRLWMRDPIRLTCLLIALVVGTATCVLPRITAGANLLLPFGGAMTVVIAGACACNLYGNDGASVWVTVLTPRSLRADVRGRQVAWLLVVGPYAVLSTVVLTAMDGQPTAWIWALSLLAALLGGGAGIVALASTIWVVPLDQAGSPTPAWSLKVHAALFAVASTAVLPVAMLVVGWNWLAIVTGVLTGLALPGWLGGRAIARLAPRQADVLGTLAGAGLR